MSFTMPTATLQFDNDEHATPFPIWRMSVSRYHQLIDAGIFTSQDKVELIRGYIIQKMSKNPPHAQATRRLQFFLSQLIGFQSGWLLSNQEPITTADSEPEPDLAILRGQLPDYDHRHPQPEDVGLIIEVADATLSYDRQVKQPLYAEAGIPVYWIVNVSEKQVEVYSQPTTAGYQQRDLLLGDDVLRVKLDGVDFGQIRLNDIFP